MRAARLILAFVLVIAVPLMMAQQKQAPEQKPTGKPPAAQAGQPGAPATGGMMTRQVAEMQKLNPLTGRWTTAEKFNPSEFMPKGGSGSGWAELRLAHGGLFMIENYHSKNDAIGPFGGHLVLWWDAKAQDYETFWCDTMMGCQPSFGSGKWEGDKLVFTSQAEMMGKKVTMRDTISDIKPDSFTFAEESSVDGGPMKPSMTIHYTRGAQNRPKPAEKPNPKP